MASLKTAQRHIATGSWKRGLDCGNAKEESRWTAPDFPKSFLHTRKAYGRQVAFGEPEQAFRASV
jgi:hypothetical protein